MHLDFFKEGNELKQKSKEELINEINNFKIENEIMIDDLKLKENAYLKSNMDNVNVFLTENLSFVLTESHNNEKIYKFIKNKEDYTVKISSYFISCNMPNKNKTYAYLVNYKNDDLRFESLKLDEYSKKNSNYSYYNEDMSKCLKRYEISKNVLEKNIKMYSEVKELNIEDLFVFNVKESKASLSMYDKDVKKYGYLVDFIKEVL